MVLFCPIQQELDCVSSSGCIIGRIKFNGAKDEHQFFLENDSIVLSDLEKSIIAERLTGLDTGKYAIPMQDDD